MSNAKSPNLKTAVMPIQLHDANELMDALRRHDVFMNIVEWLYGDNYDVDVEFVGESENLRNFLVEIFEIRIDENLDGYFS